jgi:hypothetical protein
MGGLAVITLLGRSSDHEILVALYQASYVFD